MKKFLLRLFPYTTLKSPTFLKDKTLLFAANYRRLTVLIAIVFVIKILASIVWTWVGSLTHYRASDVYPALTGYVQTNFPDNQTITLTHEGTLQTKGDKEINFPNPWTEYKDNFRTNLLVISPKTSTDELVNMDSFMVVNKTTVLFHEQDGKSTVYSIADMLKDAEPYEDIQIGKNDVIDGLTTVDTYIQEHAGKINMIVYAIGISLMILLVAIGALAYALRVGIITFLYSLLTRLLWYIQKTKISYHQAYNRTAIYMIIPVVGNILFDIPMRAYAIVIIASALTHHYYTKK